MGMFIEQAFAMDRNTWFLLLALVGGAYVIMMYQFDGHAEAILAAPFLYAGGALGRQTFMHFSLQVGDPSLNTLVSLTAGVLAMTVLLIAMRWSTAAMRA